MPEKHNELAQKVVAAFKESLHDEARGCISEGEFAKLSLMIAEALVTEKREIAELFETMARNLKAEAIPPDISM